MAPSSGRPPIKNPKNERLNLRVTPQEKAEIKKFAQENGYTLLNLIQMGIEAVKNKDNSGQT